MRFSSLAAAVALVISLPALGDTVAPSKRKVVDRSYLCGRTLLEMRSIRVAVEAYRLDHKGLPEAKNIRELKPLIEPSYIRTAATEDAWGKKILWRVSPDGKSYWIASAGSDGTYDESTWTTPGLLSSSSDDAVLSPEPETSREWIIQE